jgi:hypothetical protein
LSWLLSKSGNHDSKSTNAERVVPVSESKLSARKDQDISELREAAAQMKAELHAAVDKSGERPHNSAEEKLERLNATIRAELDAKTHLGSSNPNGWVWGIDPTTMTLCWVGVGIADGVQEGTICEVRRRLWNEAETSDAESEQLVEWIFVGKIEITQIFGPHQSDARILSENRGYKIERGDSIVVPIHAIE